MTVPRLISPFVRTRTRLTATLGVLLAATVTVASVPWWPVADAPEAAAPTAPGVVPPAKDQTVAMTEAKSTGKEVLIETATTATSLTWARPDGQLRGEYSTVPRRAKRADGQWAPIDNTLRVDGGVVAAANPAVPVHFSDGGDTVLAEVEAQGHKITYTWPEKLPDPVLDGARALYPEVRPGVDLLVTPREEGGFGQILIVKTREAAKNEDLRTLTYGLTADRAVFRHEATTGGVTIHDSVSGAEIGAIPTPIAWDAAGQDPENPATPRTSVATTADVLALSGLGGFEPGSKSAVMPTRLDGDGTGSVRLHLDAAATGLLTGPDVTFPVFLDPTINAGEQAWLFVSKSHANSNFMNGTGYNGGTSDARVGHEDDTGVTARSFWRMAFANIKTAEVSSATFKVLNNHSWSCTTREFQLYRTGAISTGTTWNKQPSWDYLQQKVNFARGYSSSCSDDYVAFNVKDAAQRAADAGATTITLGMKASTETDTLTWRKFQANTATLTAVYNRPPATPTDLTATPGGACVVAPSTRTVAKTSIILKAKATDPDGNLAKIRFRFWATTASAPTGTLVTPDSTGWATLTIATTTLTDKVSYNWDVRAEDSNSPAAVSAYAPGAQPCRITVDASAPPAPDITSTDFPEATPDGATWAKVKFGTAGSAIFESAGAVRFAYTFDGVGTPAPVTATGGKATVANLAPRHSGPNGLHVIAYDSVGNPSPTTVYTFYVPPRDTADGPGDIGGDGKPDLVVIDASGNLRSLPGDDAGDLWGSVAASYTTGGKLDPAGHWTDPATGAAALIAKHSDVYPGDGTTDLFARNHEGFWLYPGDGYGSFNVDHRLKVILPSNVPAPSTWTQIKAVGDITGDKLADLAVRSGTAFWLLSGYTGGSFQTATLMEGTSWARQEILNIADVDLDGTPDLVWRHLDTGFLYLRHGKAGTVAGSVSLDSLKTPAASGKGVDTQYGNGWTTMKAVIGIPDANGDKVPDLWAVHATSGNTYFYASTATSGGASKVVISADWRNFKAFA